MKLLNIVGIALGVALTGSAAHAQSVGKIRIAEADSFSAEDLPQLIAYARAKQRGVEIQSNGAEIG
ncbi:hypothetical protein [Pigmentiphaga litoralis]|uniref:hypothetical protein n=1 Tax=Pigmentiphaga litoralis TaxID=516702 RepID=UPI003B43449F